MSLYYVEFTTTPANLLADLNTQMANATDWSRPNSGSRPNTWKCTTTRGADMVVDFAGITPTTDHCGFQVYDAYNGTTLGNPAPMKYIYYTSGTGGVTSTKTLHVTMSVSKEHIYIDIEGPRWNETSPDNSSYGSLRAAFGLFDLVPYFASGTDPNPAVILVGNSPLSWSAPNTSTFYKVQVSKTIGGVAWGNGALQTLEFPGLTTEAVQRLSPDGNTYLSPYVYFDDTDGIRGRLNSCFYCGWNYSTQDYSIASLAANSFVTYSSVKYKIRAPYKNNVNNNGNGVGGPLGYVYNGSGSLPNGFLSVLVAVPTP